MLKRILLSSLTLALLAFAGSAVAADSQKADIVDTAVAAGKFKTLVAAVQAAGLVDTLKSDGPFTVFAPTDEAFAKLPAGTLDELLKPENKTKLQNILKYHVVPGAYKASDVMGIDSAETALGQKVAISHKSGSVMIDNATVIAADVMAANGVIHVIDTVILPE